MNTVQSFWSASVPF